MLLPPPIRKIQTFSVCAFVSLLGAVSANAATFTGEITQDTNFSAVSYVNSTVTIASGATLSGTGKLWIGTAKESTVNVNGTLSTSASAVVGSQYKSEVNVAGTWHAAGPATTYSIYISNGSAITVSGSGQLIIASSAQNFSNIYITSSGGTLNFDSADNLVLDMTARKIEDDTDSFTWKLVSSYIEKLTVNVGEATFSGDDVEAWNTYFSKIKVLGYEDWNASFTESGNAVYVNLARPIPEPSTIGLLGGAAALAFVLTRRRRKARRRTSFA